MDYAIRRAREGFSSDQAGLAALLGEVAVVTCRLESEITDRESGWRKRYEDWLERLIETATLVTRDSGATDYSITVGPKQVSVAFTWPTTDQPE